MDNNKVVIGLYYYRSGEMLLRAIETQLETGKTFKGEYFLTDATTIMLKHGAKMKTIDVTPGWMRVLLKPYWKRMAILLDRVCGADTAGLWQGCEDHSSGQYSPAYN